MTRVVNTVGSGDLGVELHLEAIARDTPDLCDYDPEKYPGLYFRFEEDTPLVTLYRTGKYIITGATSKSESYSNRTDLLNFLTDLGVLESPSDESFSMKNYVCEGDLGKSQNLNAIAISLGLENVEYEPEQFPGLIFRDIENDCVLLIFGSGKVIITGGDSSQTCDDAFNHLITKLKTNGSNGDGNYANTS